MTDLILFDLIIVGAGAAGMLAGARAAELGVRTLVVEKNRKAGVKILISGGTRCNLTHAADRRGIVEAFGQAGRFLHSALAALSPDELVALFERAGVATKVEATGKVFPASDRALDVQRALLGMLQQAGAELALGEAVTSVERRGDGGGAEFVVTTPRRTLCCREVLLTTGGQSYPGCGTTGDGYAWARSLGHHIVPPRPALAPLTSEAPWVRRLQGVTLSDMVVRVERAGLKHPPRRRGSLLFTHFGVSGPLALDLSRFVTESPQAGWKAVCDFLPQWSEDDLRVRFGADGRRTIGTVMGELLPKSVASELVQLAGADSEQRLAELSKGMRNRLLAAMKRQEFAISGSLGFKKAEVTAGGVDLREVDSRTMESKLIPGLSFAGEILDLDGPIGGYNFQAAFSTGWLAAGSIAERIAVPD